MQVYNLPFNQYPGNINPQSVPTPDYPINTGRIDWMQQLSMPFSAGALKIAPYTNVDLAYYTQDVNGDARGRVYGGLGARASLPLSRLYGDVESQLFNVKGLYHKMNIGTN